MPGNPSSPVDLIQRPIKRLEQLANDRFWMDQHCKPTERNGEAVLSPIGLAAMLDDFSGLHLELEGSQRISRLARYDSSSPLQTMAKGCRSLSPWAIISSTHRVTVCRCRS